MANADFENVTKDRPCENCGKSKFCSRTKDERTMICRFKPIPGGKKRTDRLGEYYVLSRPMRSSVPYQYSSPQPASIERASSVDLNRVYSKLLGMLDLDEVHMKDCERRGLTKQQVVERRFKSLPFKSRIHLYKELERLFGIELLKTVPGIIFKDNRWTLGGAAGMIIPVRNVSGEIIALLVKSDKPVDGNKYLWLSSAKYKGPGPGAPPHIPVQLVGGEGSVVHIVEGVLKAEIFTALSREPSIGISGVGNWKPAIEILQQFKVEKVILAIDGDAADNVRVAQPLLEMFKELSSKGFKVGYKAWDFRVAKGIDDALIANAEIKLLWGEDAENAIKALPSLNKIDNEPVTRPEVAHGIIQMHELIQNTWDVVLKANTPPAIFLRGNCVIKLVDDGRQLSIVEVNHAMMFGHLVRNADWFQERVRTSKGMEYVARSTSQPPKDLVTDLLVYPDSRLPKLNSVSDTPLIGKSGDLIIKPGYDQENFVLLDEKRLLKLPDVKLLTRFEIEESVRFIRQEVFSDFPFADEMHFTNLMALMFTVVLREYIGDTVPMFVMNATSPGSGKGLLSELVSLIVLGSASQTRPIPKSVEEMRKTITAILLNAPKIVLFDNADQESGKLHSPELAAALTSNVWSDRKLSVSEIITLENHSVFILTGNNVNLTSELSRRAIEVRLEPSSSRPWDRNQFKHKNIKQWVRRNRSSIFHALLSVCYSWINEGAKVSEKTLGSFERWAQVIGGVMEYAGLKGFLDSQGQLSHVDLEFEEWETFVKAWWDEFKGVPKRTSELFYLCERRELLTSILGVGTERSRQTKLGIEMANKRGRIFGCFGIEQTKNSGGHGKFYALVSTRLSQVHDERHPAQAAETNNDFQTQGNLEDLL